MIGIRAIPMPDAIAFGIAMDVSAGSFKNTCDQIVDDFERTGSLARVATPGF